MSSTKFILLGSQRTGSTFINDCLNSHPDVECRNELFTMHREADDCYATYIRTPAVRRLGHFACRPFLVNRFLDKTYVDEGVSAIGFKFMYSQASWLPYRFPHVMEYARRNNVRIIHLIRANYLRTLISRVIAASTNIYHSTKKITIEPIYLEADQTLRLMKRMRDERTVWREKMNDYESIEVVYEEFVQNKHVEADRLCEFLEVEPGMKLSSKLVKINPTRLDAMVKNIDEIETAIRGTEFEYCLDA